MLDEAKEVCPTNTRRMLAEGAVMIDVREPNEVAAFAFDVPGVLNIPATQLESRWTEIPSDKPVVFVCQSGARSLKATYFMQFQGYKNVSNMSGGIVKWSAKGFPVKGARAANACDCSTGCCGSAPAASDACCSNAAPASSCC
ncbi:rhodanese-like domain-containing protein [Rhodoferax sp.]|uniref:rhodanese-like domain-containing protein n=1 Tax=Rhodoferax sp. TaxID=50421 RepID=UPI0025CEF5C3|nr:rhodanese-like domain-containing protein [Rhodoferax sp.]